MSTAVQSSEFKVQRLPESAPWPKTYTQKPVIGRECMVRDHKADDRIFVGARVIDAVAGENLAKRVRLLTGEHAGEVRMRDEYDIMEFTD